MQILWFLLQKRLKAVDNSLPWKPPGTLCTSNERYYRLISWIRDALLTSVNDKSIWHSSKTAKSKPKTQDFQSDLLLSYSLCPENGRITFTESCFKVWVCNGAKSFSRTVQKNWYNDLSVIFELKIVSNWCFSALSLRWTTVLGVIICLKNRVILQSSIRSYCRLCATRAVQQNNSTTPMFV